VTGRLGRSSFTGLVAFVSVLLAFLIPQRVSGHGELLLRISAATKRIAAATNNFAQLYLERGELYREDQNWEAAEADYAKAEQLDAKLVGVDFCRARMLDDAGRLPESRTIFDKYLSRYPTDAEALIGRARVLVKLKDRKSAISDYRRGLEFSRDPQPDYYLELAQNLSAEGQGSEALQALDDGIKKLGPIPTLQVPALDIEMERKRYDAALARLETIMKPAARKESWLARRGDILLLAGRPAEARKSYEAALSAIQILPWRIQQGPAMLDLRTRVDGALSGTNSPPVVSNGTK